MKFSLYTCVRNGIYFDYHVVDMIRHHVPLFDEIVIFDGNSTDGTAKALKDIDPKVTVFSDDWGEPEGEEWFANFKNTAREKCSGEWCALLDPDEFIPEWEFERLRKLLDSTESDIVRLDWLHFYGNYRVYNGNPSKMKWATYKYQIHRNLPEMSVWGDGSNVRHANHPYDQIVSPERFECHHFGCVRWPSRLRQKLRVVGRVKQGTTTWLNLPGLLFDLLPYDWFDTDFLEDLRIYDGKLVGPVRDNPSEFTRDRMKLFKFLSKKNAKQT